MALVRSRSASKELEWLPRSYRLRRYTIQVGGFVAMAVGAYFLFGLMLAAGSFLAMCLEIVASVTAVDIVQKSLLGRLNQTALQSLASSVEDLRQLARLSDGECVRARGRVQLRGGQTLSSDADWSIAAGVVYARRAQFVLRQGDIIVDERAVDFALVDESLGEVWVDVAEARLADLQGPGVSCIRAGDLVEVVGIKSRQVDQTMSDRLDRETPMRITLRSGSGLPLLIVPIREQAALKSAEPRALPPG